MKQLKKTIQLSLLLFLLEFSLITELLAINAIHSAVSTEIQASKILVNDIKTAQKLAISFHHAILEVNYSQGYVIADLSKKEINQLGRSGFKILKATEWNKRYKQFRETIHQQLEFQVINKNVSTTIPGFACYPTVEETLQSGEDLSIAYPNLTEWIDIGDTWQKVNGNVGNGYDLMVLKITNQSIVEDKPKLFIQSSMHAREYAPAALNLDFAKKLLEEYSTNADIQWIVDYHEVHLLFHMNPDGRKIAETGELQRKNTNQNHCPSGNVGVDLNRNFAFFWNTTVNGSSGDECDQTYRGSSAESEPETKAVSNYIRSLFPDVRGENDNDAAPTNTAGMHLDLHSYSELILWPYGHTQNLSPNNQGFVALGNKLAWFNDYTALQSVGLYPTDGTSDDVSYGELGIAAITFELGTSFFQTCSVYNNKIKPDNLQALVYAAKATAAPYLLALGADVINIELNGSVNSVSVTAGTNINLEVLASVAQTTLSSTGNSISKLEYSIDTPIWKESAIITELTENDGNLSSKTEAFSAQIDSTNLSLGQHVIYLRAYDNNGNVGVPSAAKIFVAENNSPTPNVTFSCNALDCSFDASSSHDTDGTITSFNWDFNGEASATGQTVEHSFTAAGDKQVGLTILDNSNNQAMTIIDLNVTAPIVSDPEPQPLPESSNNSAGGAFGWWLAALLMLTRLKRVKKTP